MICRSMYVTFVDTFMTQQLVTQITESSQELLKCDELSRRTFSVPKIMRHVLAPYKIVNGLSISLFEFSVLK